ncbi:MAG: DUF1192 domain-containing protein [Pseudomonadota bacterium]
MISNDDLPRPKAKPHEIGQDITPLSVAELKERIVLLKEEIERLEAAAETKGSVRQMAEGLFKS